MYVCSLSGNEIFCLQLKGLLPAEIVVGNSVRSLGLAGAIGSGFRALAGGEVENITALISDGRHAAIARLVEEARRHGAHGVTGVTTELSSLAGYTEFLSQGTSVVASGAAPSFFTTSASGTELYCHLDAGYTPISFVMGNVAYALGVGRGITGGLSTLARGEVRQYSEMYNRIRHLALFRLRREAASVGANAVVDVRIDLRPFGPGIVELLMTGTASRHAALAADSRDPSNVVTSELSGAEIFSLAQLGLAPAQLVMATSVYSLGVVGGIGASFAALAKGELKELTELIYGARENCLSLLRAEAQSVGAERVIGNRLQIRELSPGLIEVVAVGTAVRRLPGIAPHSASLPIQAVVRDDDSLTMSGGGSAGFATSLAFGSSVERNIQQRLSPSGCLLALVAVGMLLIGVVVALIVAASR
ncbi:MAG TPA: heavy metal-binding domain-containing protein [Polyangiaceae bacterium]|nr:heavy metal-binding domain-containing protein [Polyangiaceae bacterium]